MLPKLVEVIALIVALFAFYTVVGMWMFKDYNAVYDYAKYKAADGLYTLCDGEYNGTCADIPESVLNQTFSQSYGHAGLALFVLLSTSNYPSLSTYFFLMNVIVAVMYAGYRDVNLTLLKREAHREKVALETAYRVLDILDGNYVSFELFSLLMKEVDPRKEPYKLRAMFRLLDKRKSGYLELHEFLHLTDVLSLSITMKTGTAAKMAKRDSRKSYFGADFAASENCATCCLFIDQIRGYMEKIVLSLLWHILFGGMGALCSVIALLFYALNRDKFGFIDKICAYCFTGQVAFAMFGLGWSKYWLDHWQKFDFVITTCSLIGNIALSYQGSFLPVFRYLGILRLLQILNLVIRLQFIRAFRVSSLTATFVRMVPVFVQMAFSLVAVVFYMFAVIGMELFTNDIQLSPNQTYKSQLGRCSDTAYWNSVPSARFCDFGAGLSMLFQILVNNDWPDTMYAAIEEYGFNTCAFFLVYYCIACIIMLNLLTAVFVDIFMAQTEVRDKGKSLAKILQAQGVVLPESHAPPQQPASPTSPNDATSPSNASHGTTPLLVPSGTNAANAAATASLPSPPAPAAVSPPSGITATPSGGVTVDPALASVPTHRIRASVVAPGAPAFLRARSIAPTPIDMKQIDARLEYAASGFGSSSDIPSPTTPPVVTISGGGGDRSSPPDGSRLTVASPSAAAAAHARNRSGGFTSGEWKRNVHSENQQRLQSHEMKPSSSDHDPAEVTAALAADNTSPTDATSPSAASAVASARLTIAGSNPYARRRSMITDKKLADPNANLGVSSPSVGRSGGGSVAFSPSTGLPRGRLVSRALGGMDKRKRAKAHPLASVEFTATEADSIMISTGKSMTKLQRQLIRTYDTLNPNKDKEKANRGTLTAPIKIEKKRDTGPVSIPEIGRGGDFNPSATALIFATALLETMSEPGDSLRTRIAALQEAMDRLFASVDPNTPVY